MSEAEIDEIREAFAQAENRGDPSVQLEYRDDENYVRMPPGSPPMGAEAAAETLRDLYEEGNFKVTWESDGVLVSGDLAVDGGPFTLHWEEEGKSVERQGSWLLVFQRNDAGEWKVVRDMYNWDEPEP